MTDLPAAEPAVPAATAPLIVGPPVDAIKLIFLDVDGVICCNGQGRLEEDKLGRIRKVAEASGAKIVLSTDWRRDPSLKATISTSLTERGMQVIGATRKPIAREKGTRRRRVLREALQHRQ